MNTKTIRVLATSALLITSWPALAGQDWHDDDRWEHRYRHHRVVFVHQYPVREIVEQRCVERVASVRPHRTVMMTPPVVNPVEAPHPAIEATAKALRRRKPSNGGAVVAIGPGLCGISVGTVGRPFGFSQCPQGIGNRIATQA